ncbi:hypothetical protein CBL_09407 [Carabus blaptoides fortunei]
MRRRKIARAPNLISDVEINRLSSPVRTWLWGPPCLLVSGVPFLRPASEIPAVKRDGNGAYSFESETFILGGKLVPEHSGRRGRLNYATEVKSNLSCLSAGGATVGTAPVPHGGRICLRQKLTE